MDRDLPPPLCSTTNLKVDFEGVRENNSKSEIKFHTLQLPLNTNNLPNPIDSNLDLDAIKGSGVKLDYGSGKTLWLKVNEVEQSRMQG